MARDFGRPLILTANDLDCGRAIAAAESVSLRERMRS
jgi:hypothetical protein